jgi:hypothetical protein
MKTQTIAFLTALLSLLLLTDAQDRCRQSDKGCIRHYEDAQEKNQVSVISASPSLSPSLAPSEPVVIPPLVVDENEQPEPADIPETDSQDSNAVDGNTQEGIGPATIFVLAAGGIVLVSSLFFVRRRKGVTSNNSMLEAGTEISGPVDSEEV